jgi:putative ubiquitin-RnfH superfamily antitoxin RatB of RatAB toxin-antitoxin module
MLEISLVYIAANGDQIYRNLDMAEGSTVADALTQANFHTLYPEAKAFALGIFSKPVELTQLLKTGDRIEVYRPLVSDPKEKRKQRAFQAKLRKVRKVRQAKA